MAAGIHGIRIIDRADLNDFRKLMEKHGVEIVEVEDEDADEVVFRVRGEWKELEEIMTGELILWEFA
jgi:hypothetical protein